MPNTVQLTKNGQPVFPVTDVSLVMGLQDAIKLPPVKTATLPTASAETAGKMYYVGPTDGEYERYITSAVNGSYEWIDLGSTAIPLPSIADNLTTDDPEMALSAAQGKVLDGKVSQLGQKVTEKRLIFDEITPSVIYEGTYLNGNGEVVQTTTPGATVKEYNYSDGDIYISGFSPSSIGGNLAVAFYDGDTFLGGEKFGSSVGFSHIHIIPLRGTTKYRIMGNTLNGDNLPYSFILEPFLNEEFEKLKEVGSTYYGDTLRFGFFRMLGLGIGDAFTRDFRSSTTKLSSVIRLIKGDTINLRTKTTSAIAGSFVSYVIVGDDGKIIAINNEQNADYLKDSFEYTAVDNCTIIVGCDNTEASSFMAFVTRKRYKKLRICVIGNSYSLDSFMYLPFILLNYGIISKFGVYYRSNGSLQNQVEEYSSGSNPYYSIDTESELSWTEHQSYSPEMAIMADEWDIVVIQQSSTQSLDINTYEPYARNLINQIASSLRNPFVLSWNININRYGGVIADEQNLILQNINTIVDSEPVSIIFPYGTAIFDARTNAILDALGDGGHLWAADKIHLQEGLPCYIAALANAQKIFDRYYPEFSVLGDITIPDEGSITLWNIMGQQGSPVGVTDANRRLAQVCAVVANNNMFSIKTII